MQHTQKRQRYRAGLSAPGTAGGTADMGFLCTIGSLDQDPQSGCGVGAGLARLLLSQEGKSAGTNPLAQRRGALRLYIEHFFTAP